MKRIITLILLLSSAIVYGQNDINRQLPVGNSPSNPATYNKQTVNDNNLRARLTLYIPNGAAPTLNNAKDSTGAVYYATADSSFNIKIGGGQWVKYKSYEHALNALNKKVDKVPGKGLSTEDFSSAEKAKLAGLHPVATSGDYNALNNKPTIPAAQVNADWNATSGVAAILNKPDLSLKADVSALATKVDKVAGKGLSTEDYSTAEKTKLAGIAAGATANATDAQLRDRTTHTGVQAISTVSGLQTALDGKEPANANIQAHIASTSNPHSVTKAQVGLGNVDNTADLLKPISNATQTALNAKANNDNVVHLTGNEIVDGVKTFKQPVTSYNGTTGNATTISHAAGLTLNQNGAASGKSVTIKSTTALSDIVIEAPNTNGKLALISDITKSAVGLGNVDNTSDLNKPISTATQTALDGKLNTSDRGANNGVAPLDAGGKVPFANLPASLMIYKGVWTPSTNTPALADGTGVNGWVYKASANGTANLGSGSISFLAGDFVIHNGTNWERSVGTDNVVSVNGQQGVVSLNSGNVPEGSNLYYTDARVSANATVAGKQNQLNGTGFVKASGTSISYDNTSYEPAFSKNTAFNKNFGTVAGTVAEGNDSRIVNGQTAFGWGNHAGRYPLYDGTGATGTWGINISGSAATANNSSLWNGQAFIGANSSIGAFLTNVTSTNQYGYSTIPQVQSALGLSSAAYLEAYVGEVGNTVVKRGSIGDVIGSYLRMSAPAVDATGITDIVTTNGDATLRRNSATSVRTFLGMPSGGETLQSVTDRGNVINNFLKITGVANVRGGTGLELFYSGQGVINSYDRDTESLKPLTVNASYVNFGIGNIGAGYPTDQGYKLAVNGTGYFNGTVTASGGFFNSDIRLKNLVKYRYNHTSISNLQPITYTWKDGRDSQKHIGYSAQEVEKILPDAISTDAKGMKSVNYVEVLVAKIQSLEEANKELLKRIEKLEKGGKR